MMFFFYSSKKYATQSIPADKTTTPKEKNNAAHR